MVQNGPQRVLVAVEVAAGPQVVPGKRGPQVGNTEVVVAVARRILELAAQELLEL
jgi:hypothetical protein